MEIEDVYVDLTGEAQECIYIQAIGDKVVVGVKPEATLVLNIELIPREWLFNRFYEQTTEQGFFLSCADLVSNRGRIRIKKSDKKEILKKIRSEALLYLFKKAEIIQ